MQRFEKFKFHFRKSDFVLTQLHFRSFQTANQIFKPDIVLILGDLFDEGNWVSDKDFESYVERFKSNFYVSDPTRIYYTQGNHDVNFHYQMTQKLLDRFNRAFNTSSVKLIREKKLTREGKETIVNFVFLNSMAMERDGCDLCNEAEEKLKSVAKSLEELKIKNEFTNPIVIQHFPNYRKNDDECLDKNSKNYDVNRENWDTLSNKSTLFIAETLNPRAYLSGHSHHYCRLVKDDVVDITLSSFNMRNINNPSFLLAIFTPEDFSFSRCETPKESTLIICYILGLLLSIFVARKRNLHLSLQRFFEKRF